MGALDKRFFTLRTILQVALSIGIACAFFLSLESTFAAPNYQINYQGKLTASTSATVADGAYDMEFSLYTAQSGGSPIWTETLNGADAVSVTSGLFSVMLGSTTPLSSVDFNQTLYLGVTIEGDSEMSPRKVLGAVPAAFEAEHAADSDTVGGVASTSFLRSDQADTATGLLTFTNGFLSQASSTIARLTTLTATTTNLVINGERFTDLTGTGLQNTGNTLAINTTYLNTLYASTSAFNTCSELAAILSGNTTGSCGSFVLSASPTFTGTVNAAAVTLSSTLTLSGTSANIALGNNYLSGDGGDEGVFVTGAGNVGVGTTTVRSKLSVYGDLFLEGTSRYLNFGTATGSSGYGFRDNAGTLEFKNVGGGWNNVSIATSGPAFSVSGTSNQTVTANTQTLITWDTERFDTNNNFDLGTNRFTPTVPGKYVISAGIRCLDSVECNIYLRKNGSDVHFNESRGNSSSADINAVISTVVEMNGTTDYLELYGRNVESTVIAKSTSSWFSGSLIAPVYAGAGGGWTTNGTVSYLIDNADNVGIGTTTTANNKLAIFNNGADASILLSTVSGANEKWTIGIDDSDGTKFKISSSSALGTNDRFVINGAGNIGIGTSTPSRTLTVAGTMRLTGALYDSLNSAGSNGMVLQSTATGQRWVATSTLGFLATAGIDTSAELSAIVTDETGSGRLVFSGSPAFSGTATFSALTATSTLTLSGTAANIALGSNWLSGDGEDEGVFVTGAGNVGVGTTTAKSKLSVYGDLFLNGTSRYLNFGTATGTSGYGFRDNAGTLEFKNNTGSWTGIATGGVGVSSISKQTFTASGTYTPATGMLYAIVECVGGGGGGGGTLGVAGNTMAASGGGAGGYSRAYVTAADIGASKSVTIGSGGSGATGHNNGVAGGQTSLGSLCVANGGSGGVQDGLYGGANGVSGGAAGTGNIVAVPGASSDPVEAGNNSNSDGPAGFGGTGASSQFGAGGTSAGVYNGVQNGGNASGYGAGGAGSASHNSSSSGTGGNGSSGIVIVTEYIGGAVTEGTVASGTAGQFALYNTSGTTLSGTSALFLATTTGNIGIGTTTPNQRLTIYRNGADAAIELSATLGASRKWTFGLDYSDGGKFKISSSSALGTNDRFVIDGAGNVGIGTSSPSRLLTVAGTMRLTGALYDSLNSAGTLGMVLQSTATGQRWVATSTLGISGGPSLFTDGGATTYLTATTDNFAIGTTTGNQALTIFRNGADAALQFSTISGANEKWTIGIDDSDKAKFKISSSSALGTNDRFVIDGAGRIGIGTTSPSRRLSVTDTVAAAQMALAYDSTRAAYFQVDSVGDLLLNATGGDLRLTNNNLWVCESGSCPSITASSTAGYTVVENGIYFGNGFKIDQIAGTTTELGVYNASGSVIMIFEQ